MGLDVSQTVTAVKTQIEKLPVKHKKEIKNWLDFVLSSSKEKVQNFLYFIQYYWIFY